METRPVKIPKPDHPITIKQNLTRINALEYVPSQIAAMH